MLTWMGTSRLIGRQRIELSEQSFIPQRAYGSGTLSTRRPDSGSHSSVIVSGTGSFWEFGCCISMLQTFLQDFRFSVRVLRRNPGFLLGAITSISLGIGAKHRHLLGHQCGSVAASELSGSNTDRPIP